ncbi:MAG: hypothetical protein WCR08_09845 [Gammaproteobacteria bacterium]
MKISKQVRKNLIKGVLTTTAAGLLALGMGISPASAQKVNGCSTFSSGRTTCSYSSGGGTSWSSSNPNSGYTSNGYRYNSGTSSYGSYDWSKGSKSGTRSFSSSGSIWP